MVRDSSSQNPCKTVEHHGRTVLCGQAARFRIQLHLLTSCVTSGKFLNISVPPFSALQNEGGNSIHLRGLLGGLHELAHKVLRTLPGTQ